MPPPPPRGGGGGVTVGDLGWVGTLGASAAPIAKIRGKFRFHILLQGPCGNALRAAVRRATSDVKTPDQLQWIVDVDPIDML